MGKIFCKHKYPKGSRIFRFVGDDFDIQHTRLYIYQNYCYNCGKRVRMVADDYYMKDWMEHHEIEI